MPTRKGLPESITRALQARDGIIRAEQDMRKAQARRTSYQRSYRRAIKRLNIRELQILQGMVRGADSPLHGDDRYLEERMLQ